MTRNYLLGFEYKPSFDIPDDWWGDEETRNYLLGFGYKPSFDISGDWRKYKITREELFYREIVRLPPAFKIVSSHQSLPLSSLKSPSITPISDSHIDPLHVPLPPTLPAQEPVVLGTSGTSAGDVEDTLPATLPTLIPSGPLPIAPLVPNPVPDTMPAEDIPITIAIAVTPSNSLPVILSPNGSTSDVGTQSSGPRPRSRVKRLLGRFSLRP